MLFRSHNALEKTINFLEAHGSYVLQGTDIRLSLDDIKKAAEILCKKYENQLVRLETPEIFMRVAAMRAANYMLNKKNTKALTRISNVEGIVDGVEKGKGKKFKLKVKDPKNKKERNWSTHDAIFTGKELKKYGPLKTNEQSKSTTFGKGALVGGTGGVILEIADVFPDLIAGGSEFIGLAGEQVSEVISLAASNPLAATVAGTAVVGGVIAVIIQRGKSTENSETKFTDSVKHEREERVRSI